MPDIVRFMSGETDPRDRDLHRTGSVIRDKENFSPVGGEEECRWEGEIKWAATVTYEADKKTKLIGERVSPFNYHQPKSFSLVF